MENKDQFKLFGRFVLHGCLVDITRKETVLTSPCQEEAQRCAKYLYAEGFVDEDDVIRFEHKDYNTQ
jgi:hypothetical protein